MDKADSKPKQPGIFSLLKPYRGLVFLLILFALFSNSVYALAAQNYLARH